MTINTHIKLHDAAREADLSPHGLLKILKRTGSVIRDDGRWYVLPDVLAQVIQARRILGIGAAKQSIALEKQ
jgi:hypothetical protein